MSLTHLLPRLLRYAELRASGLSRRQIERLLTTGALTRVRKGTYVSADADERSIEAARLGGRLDCVSLLSALGVFVLASAGIMEVFGHGQDIADALGVRREPTGRLLHLVFFAFLTRDCCCGRPEICAPILESLSFDLQPGA